MENREERTELLANIRRLTVMVLDDLEKGSKNLTLDQGQKRLLSSTDARLLRLWRIVEREKSSKRAADAARSFSHLSKETQDSGHGSETC